MQMPFSAEQFFGVFRSYNLAVWPAQPLLLALALLAFALVLVSARSPNAWASAVVSAILALLWAWTALAYHLVLRPRGFGT
jgi:lipopolysaccharide export LptBFGC system permease protein LptF